MLMSLVYLLPLCVRCVVLSSKVNMAYHVERSALFLYNKAAEGRSDSLASSDPEMEETGFTTINGGQ